MRFFTLLLFLTLTTSACGGGGGGGGGGSSEASISSPTESTVSIEQLAVPSSFDYDMSQGLDLNITVAPAGFSSRAYTVLVYDLLANGEESLIGKFQTNQVGELSTNLTVPANRLQLKVLVSAFGFPNEKLVDIVAGQAAVTFN